MMITTMRLVARLVLLAGLALSLSGAAEAASEQAIQAARDRVRAAQTALTAAQDNSTPEDWVYVNKDRNPQGIRRFPKPEYQARLERLEQDIKRAEEELKKLERDLF